MNEPLDSAASVQLVSECESIPSKMELNRWIGSLLAPTDNVGTMVTVRIVDSAESQAMNNQYRGKDKPTNVLSFPAELPPDIEPNYLGDIIICAPVVEREAVEQGKSLNAHWAHMLVHGVLHLQGYDHQDESEALLMESKETALMREMGFNNPYAE